MMIVNNMLTIETHLFNAITQGYENLASKRVAVRQGSFVR